MQRVRYRPILTAGLVGVMLLLASCGNDSDNSSPTDFETSRALDPVRIDPDGVECNSIDGSVFTCKFDAADTQVIRINLVDFVSELSTHGVTNDTPLVIQAYGGGALNNDSNVDGGVAQTVTTVSDFQDRFGTTETYLYVGLEGNSKCVEEDEGSNTSSPTADGSSSNAGGSECAYQYGGGTATIVSTVDGSSEADNFDIASNVVLLAGGAGSGGGSNVNDIQGGYQGDGGAGGVAVSTSTSDSDCEIPGASFGALCSPGADGTAGDQNGHKPTTGKGGAMGTGGTGETTGGNGTGGAGGAAYDNVSSGWAGGFSPSYVVDQGIGAGATGSRAKGGSTCTYTGRINLAFGGSGGGGFGGGGGAHADEACPWNGGPAAVGSGGGGAASFAMVSTQTYTESPATPASGDGKFVLVFVVPAS